MKNKITKKHNSKYFNRLQKKLIKAAKTQDNYDLNTINLIAPASPTKLEYYYNIPLKHNAIAEGLLGHRPYAGVSGFNAIEKIATEAACRLFRAQHANVQPHSVSQANQAVYQALLKNQDLVLAMRFHDGGHLTHGLKINFSGRFFNFHFYGVDKNGTIDYREIEKKAVKLKPKIIICGTSSYPRTINFKKLKKICKKTNSYLLADLSHPAGLIVANKFPQPFPYCDVVTLTPDKTMLGPHGGIILCKKTLAQKIDQGVHPGTQSSIPLRRIYETAQCLIDSGQPWFKDYVNRVIKNMKVFENEFKKYPGLMITGGSDTHLMVINTYKIFGLTGKQSEELLEKIGILTNRQVIPQEKLKSCVTSGLRLGTSWITARGYSKKENKLIAQTILKGLQSPMNHKLQKKLKEKMDHLLKIKRPKDVWKNETLR